MSSNIVSYFRCRTSFTYSFNKNGLPKNLQQNSYFVYNKINGGCRQAVTALVCGTSIRGFKSRHSPF
jgi:hypothetical protein